MQSKIARLFPLLGIVATTASLSASPVATPRPTSEQLASIQSGSRAHYSKEISALSGESRKSSRSEGDLLGRSAILSDGHYWTIVPKGAVLNLPSQYRDRLVNKPTGTLQSWATFCQRNRGWIHLQQVDLTQARGERPLSEAAVKAYQGTGRVVVAVFRQGPIGVSRATTAGADKLSAMKLAKYP